MILLWLLGFLRRAFVGLGFAQMNILVVLRLTQETGHRSDKRAFINRVFDGRRNHLLLILVRMGRRKHHDKESEQQRNKIGIRDQPPLMVGMLRMLYFAGHLLGLSLLRRRSTGGRKGLQFDAQKLGVHAFHNAGDAFHRKFHQAHLFVRPGLDLIGGRQQKDVG